MFIKAIGWLAVVVLCALAALLLLWGAFCFMGGPDPGAGSGHEGPKWGMMFCGAGLVLLASAYVIRKAVGSKRGQG